MRVFGMSVSFLVAFLAVGLLVAQEPKPAPTKEAPKAAKEDPKTTKDEPKPKVDPKVDPKVKGQLPPNWKQLGLTDEQVQKVYKINAKYTEDIDKLEAEIKELKAKMSKERSEVLTAEQKKRLEEILKTKSGTDK